MTVPLLRSPTDEKGEVNLLAIKKKRIENLRTKSTVETNDIGTQCDAELDDLAAKQKIKEEAEMKVQRYVPMATGCKICGLLKTESHEGQNF